MSEITSTRVMAAMIPHNHRPRPYSSTIRCGFGKNSGYGHRRNSRKCILVVLLLTMQSLSSRVERRTSQPPFRRVGILYHPKKPESRQLAEEMAAHLAALGSTEIWLE